jgi:beta-galactosidase/beta-glucuronidase
MMTDAKVMVNGKQAGPVHQGAFYRFKYDITWLLKPAGKNLLEVTVDKTSANSSVNDAERRNSDFWVLGGIYRPVYLEVVPETFIDRTSVDAKADGSFLLNIFARNLKGNETITAQVQTLKGQNVGAPMHVRADAAADSLQLKGYFSKPALWSAEFPNLYQVVASIKNNKGVIHQHQTKIWLSVLSSCVRMMACM